MPMTTTSISIGCPGAVGAPLDATARPWILNQMVERTTGPASTFAALGHPVRLDLVERLRRGEARVTELAHPFPISLAAVSKHLRVLEGAGVIRRRVVGRDHWIALDLRPLAGASAWLADPTAFWTGRLDALEAQLEPPSDAVGVEDADGAGPRARSA